MTAVTFAPARAPRTADTPIVSVDGLSIDYARGRNRTRAVDDVSFRIYAGQKVAIVGESGSGKSTTAHAIINLLPDEAVRTAGTIFFQGRDLSKITERQWRRLRGAGIGFVPQDPMVSLNPLRTVGHQIAEVLRIHGNRDRDETARKAVELLDLVGIPQPDVRARQYPDQFSGGMRQRVLIAIALAAEPFLVIADEPTSALDVTVQKQILDHFDELVTRTGTSLLLVTHDLGVAADRADTVLVFSGGRLVEQGPAARILQGPEQAYTQQLIAAAPSLHSQIAVAPRTGRGAAETILSVQDVSKSFDVSRSGRSHERIEALSGVSVDLARGETLALVGESGSGKSTLARIILHLEEPSSGRVSFLGQDYADLDAAAFRRLRQRISLVYQSPFGSLNPRLSLSDIVTEPLRNFRVGSTSERRSRGRELLDAVGLPPSFAHRVPAELSGGQRQRVAIARALALSPELIVLDEPVSALDVSVQAQILDLLIDTQERTGVGYLFISHDLAVVRQISHRVAVLNKGELMELDDTETVFRNPQSAYTRLLLDAIPGRGARPAPGGVAR